MSFMIIRRTSYFGGTPQNVGRIEFQVNKAIQNGRRKGNNSNLKQLAMTGLICSVDEKPISQISIR